MDTLYYTDICVGPEGVRLTWVCIARNLFHFEGSPGLMRRYSPGMGVWGFPLTIALRLS